MDNGKKLIYLDNAATTAMYPEVFDAMEPFLRSNFANPSAIYSYAQEAKKVVDDARQVVADSLGAKANEIYFTSGGSEADNWAIKGAAFALKNKGKHIITSTIEHHAVLHTVDYLEKIGYEVTKVGVDENGIIKLDELENAIREDTILITVMAANNEIGTIQPIKEIGEIAKQHNILFHTDAVQAYCHIPMNVDELGVNMLSASAHKFGGPKGIGFMYMKNGTKLDSLVMGGGQERGKRAGTENVAGIVGLAKAVEISLKNMESNMAHEIEVRDHYIEKVLEEIPYCRLNGHRTKRLPNNINFSFRFIEGESLLILLDMNGICASSGSACTSGSLDPSHVLLGIGLPHEIAHGSLRTTISHETTIEDMDYTVECLKKIVERLRSMSPLYEDFIKEQK